MQQRIAANLQRIHERIHAVGGDPDRLHLLAVTKTQAPDILPALRACGLTEWGENRVDHLEAMQAHPTASDGSFHYIGRVQSRQFPAIVGRVASLHSLCEIGHVAKLERAAAAAGREAFPVFLQVNTAGEAQKAGLSPGDLPAMIDAVAETAHLQTVGLMCMAPDRDLPGVDEAQIRHCFARLRDLADRHGLERLSMGMSKDYDLAVQEGATDLRLGTCLFADPA